MAAVNFFIGFMYEVVESAWMLSSILMKFFLLGVLVETVRMKDFSMKGLDKRLREGGKYMVLGIGVLAVPVTLLGLSFQPTYLFGSQFIAVSILGYLFWKY